jgi:hypothetical protein
MDSLPAVRHRQNSGGPTAGSAYGIQDGQNQPVAAKKAGRMARRSCYKSHLLGRKRSFGSDCSELVSVMLPELQNVYFSTTKTLRFSRPLPFA